MQQEARDFEILRDELNARIRELVPEAAEDTPSRPDEYRAPSPGEERTSERGTTEVPIFPTLQEVERDYIVRVLEAKQWRVSGPKGAARILGLNPSTLRSRMKKLRISRDISRKREI